MMRKHDSQGSKGAGINDDWLTPFNVVWSSPSKNSSESMPCGGGDIGLNVWVEDGDLLFFVCRSGNFDENGTLLKNGRVRMRMTPNPFEQAEGFQQELRLEQGFVSVVAGPEGQQVRVQIWVDVFRPVVHVQVEADFEFTAESVFESWRFEDRKLEMEEKGQCNGYSAYAGDVLTHRDEIAWSETDGGLLFYHRNRTEALMFNFVLHQQKLGDEAGLWNPQKNLTFGGVLRGAGLVFSGLREGARAGLAFRGWGLVTEQPARCLELELVLHTEQAETPDAWLSGLRAAVREAERVGAEARVQTEAWWREFWSRSRIVISGPESTGHDQDSVAWQVGRNYQLVRHMLGCNARGEFGQKFNGGMFTADAMWVRPEYRFTPDFRCWGGSVYTAQNQRLLFWPMLKSGDFELPVQEFERYRRGLPAAERRTRVHWGHAGASFTEQIEYFGLPGAAFWGFGEGRRTRPADLDDGALTSPWVRRYFVTQLEFCYMILEWARFTGEGIDRYLGLIESCLEFYEQHYGGSSPLRMEPAQSIEMYFGAVNPTPDLAALQVVITELLHRPELAPGRRTRWQALLDRVPELPVEERGGVEVFAPAETYDGTQQNMEIPELYPVFPWGCAGIGIGRLDLARATWAHGVSNNQRQFTECWSQVAIFAARLGLTEEAGRLITDKFGDSPRRFPAFWGPGPDYVPDMDHAGSAMIALQEMLLQTPGDKLILFPAWPKDWDVDFTLHAPKQTTVSASLRGGRIVALQVSPEERGRDVLLSGHISK